MNELLNIYSQCFPHRDAAAEIKALGDNFNFNIDEEGGSFIIFRITSLEEAEIIDIGTLPDARRKGAATRLIEDTLLSLADISIDTVYLEVAEDNKAALQLYDKCGFKPYNRRKAYYKGPNGRIDAILMKKNI